MIKKATMRFFHKVGLRPAEKVYTTDTSNGQVGSIKLLSQGL